MCLILQVGKKYVTAATYCILLPSTQEHENMYAASSSNCLQWSLLAGEEK